MRRGLATGLLVILMAVGCTAGTEFIRPAPESLELGKTTYKQILDRHGKPYQESTGIQNGETVTSITYSYATATPYVEKIPARAMAFYFNKSVLVGYEYTSSFDEDKTDFDDTKVSLIKKGETTQAQVIGLLGQAGGRYIYPVIKEHARTALVYLYVRTDKHPVGGLKGTRRKVLVVTFDPSGKVSDVTLNISARPK